MLLIVLIACVVALLTCHGIDVSIKGFQLRLIPSNSLHTTVVRWGITIACSIVAILAIISFVSSFRQTQCSVMLEPAIDVACFSDGRSVEVVARPFQDGELVANSFKAISPATGELGVVNTTDGISIVYGTSTVGSVDDESLAVAGYYRTPSEIIGPTYVVLTDEATSGDPLVGVSENTVSKISAEFIGVSVKVIEWYTGRSDVIAVRATFDETAISSDISRDTEIRIESRSFVIVFKLISLDLREREKVRATFLMLKYPR